MNEAWQLVDVAWHALYVGVTLSSSLSVIWSCTPETLALINQARRTCEALTIVIEAG